MPAQLKELGSKPWIIAALISWGIAFFGYMLQVPANRIGFAVFYMKQPMKLDFLYAGVCLLGAVYFMFRTR